MVATGYPRTFVPQDLRLERFGDVEPLYRELIDRPIDSPAALERWLRDFSELASVVDEVGSRRYIDKSCHTDDAAIQQLYMQFVEEIEPKIKPLCFRLQKKFVESPHRKQLTDPRYAMLERQWRPDVELFREENVPLETEITKLANEYDTVCAAMTVKFRGQELTLQQVGRFLEEPNRATREEAYRATVGRRLVDKEAIESVFDRMLPIREEMAHNAGMEDFRAYMWKEMKRFDYTPDDCLRFGDAIAETVVPLVNEFDRQRKVDMKLDRLRPWDTAVDPKDRPPLRPFKEDQTDLLVDKTKEIFQRMSPQLAEDLESLRRNKNLDLASRKGKQPGGYQATLEERREPFIFMNAVGLQRDVETLLHEGGHAFHTIAAKDEPLQFLRSAPIEFCEVASMSMEALGAEHMEVFYPDPAEAARAKRTYFEKVITLLPWIATIDGFQHWIYTHPGHTRDERAKEWMRLRTRFGPSAEHFDFSGFEDYRRHEWHRQLHLFQIPFYYVEYGIAQLGALQLWMKARENPRQAMANYRAALALGGKRPLPELFAAAGIRFDFSAKTLGPLMRAVGEELDRLPR
ncbi:MAG: M3 family oligoendopeptidase [Planctomycetota bacterium]|nr:M3 family oligoendopeptidase [Planctomycetota bacterium]